MKKKQNLREHDLLRKEVMKVSVKCDTILSNVLILRQQIASYPQMYVESVDNLYKATMELERLCAKRAISNRRHGGF